MPFKSKAQRRWMYANHPKMAKEWNEHTAKKTKLPEYVKSAMNTQEQAYLEGFVKRANECGFNEDEALDLLKEAKDTSFLGRYFASGQVMPSIQANKSVIMHKLDPTGKYQNENVFLTPEMYKKQRELAYDHMRNTMLRESGGTYAQNALVGGLGGAGLGALYSKLENSNPLIGAGIGAGGGALLGLLGRGISKAKQKMITDDDIALMKKQQKNHGIFSDLMPFRDVVDAANAE